MLRKLINLNLSRILWKLRKCISNIERHVFIITVFFLHRTLIYWRYVQDGGRAIITGMHVPFFLRILIKKFTRQAKRTCWLQGMGRHSPSEIEHMGRQDLAAVSGYLGKDQGKHVWLLCQIIGSAGFVFIYEEHTEYVTQVSHGSYEYFKLVPLVCSDITYIMG